MDRFNEGGSDMNCMGTKQLEKQIEPPLGSRKTPTDATETLRAAVDKKLSEYVYQHYQTGVSSTYTLKPSIAVPDEAAPPSEADGNEAQTAEQPETQDEPVKLCMHIVGNKYNLRNFWAGRWRSTYVVNVNARAFSQATIQIQSHYFENGNVQMHVGCEPDLPTLAADTNEDLPEAILSAIHAYEQAYQDQLCETTNILRDDAFKALRRTLPITRQKIDWDKVVSYKLGSELANK
ncbi:F-actin-capping protein subunit alpha [Malassezia caprae]|uniref:F-actin-capping protein subunit alpha n=1 Tax=Malassezia caprae TaxID=1381934 RepID=A0AAF0E7K0_9BASI|nr:F-actin-capping protein subunit alpha [Malassezia caprae]